MKLGAKSAMASTPTYRAMYPSWKPNVRPPSAVSTLWSRKSPPVLKDEPRNPAASQCGVVSSSTITVTGAGGGGAWTTGAGSGAGSGGGGGAGAGAAATTAVRLTSVKLPHTFGTMKV